MISQVKEFKPDIVVFDNSRTTAGMLNEVKKTGVKTITIHHNYEMEYYSGTKPSIAWRIPFMYYMEKAERTAVQKSDLNLTLTDEDIKLLQIHYDTQRRKKIVKLGSFESVIDSKSINSEHKDSIKKTDKKLYFAITGTLGSYQTEMSVIPFLENEYPELLKLIPESKLIIAGRNPSDKMKDVCLKYPSIELIANPESMMEIMAYVDVYICPTCVGGGLKLRVMDGLKAGLPILTHVVSARGYEEFQKANCLFSYENTDSFRISLKKLISEKNKGKLDPKTIKDLYNSIFSFEAGVKRLGGILKQYELI